MSTPQRILWIRLDHIGDVVMSLPALQLLRSSFPSAQLDALMRPTVAPLLHDLNLVDRVFTYDTPRFPESRNKMQWLGSGAGPFRTMQLMRRLRERHYDLAIDQRGDDVARVLAFGARIPQRVGPDRIFYEQPGARNLAALMTHAIALPVEPRHAAENNWGLVQPLTGTEKSVELYRWPISPAQRERVASKLDALNVRESFAVIQARSNDSKRDWEAEKFAVVADYLAAKYGLAVLLCGARSDAEYNDSILRQVNSSARIHNLAGLFTLAELPGLFERATLMVTVDTGPMHLAATVNTPIVALMLDFLAPRHHPFAQPDAVVLPPDGGTVQDIHVADVLAKVDEKLAV